MRPSQAKCLLVLSAVTSLCTLAFAQTSDGEGGADRVRAAMAYLNGLDGYSVDIQMELRLVPEGGEPDGVTLTGKLAMAGEHELRFQVASPQESLELVANKDDTFLYLASQKKYVDDEVLGSRKSALESAPSGPFRGAQIILSDFLHNSPDLLKTLENGEVTKVESTPTPGQEQFRVVGGGINCDFWIDEGETPRLNKFALDISELANRGPQKLEEAKLIYSFTEWNVAPSFPEGHFTFQIPEGASKMEMQGPQAQADSLVDAPAPAIELPLLGGGTLDLAAHNGKNVVILDFWATWCGPCRIGLPIATKVSERYKDKGVVFYAVNIAEDERTIQAFLEQTGIEATIALDSERTAQRAYQATSIPKTVIIGKDGFVREVHAGVSPRFEEDLSKALDELTE